MAGSQFVLDLELEQSWDEANFFVAACNEHAMRRVQDWPNWPSYGFVIHGPPGCGKTHLAQIWQKRASAHRLKASTFTVDDLQKSKPPFLIEDADAELFDERLMFHALNIAREHSSWILLTSRLAPGRWELSLPDLKSRVRSLPSTAILEPDDEILAAVLLKHITDRQLVVAPEVIPFVLSRMERSLAAAEALVAELDHRALAEQRKITKPFAAKTLRDMLQPSIDGG